jgi:hypothetical protein
VVISLSNELRLDWCDAKAARYACLRWHYAKRVPVLKAVRIGVWEYGEFVGVIMFGLGANPKLCRPYELTGTEVCELTRIALRRHRAPVSRMIAVAVRMLRQICPKLRLIVSFADTTHGHHGGIYQAAGWIYAGGTETHAYRVDGKVVHPKTLHNRYGKGGQSIPWLRSHVDPRAMLVSAGFKHRYLLPLDLAMRQRTESLARPYPKRVKQATDAYPAPGGGAAPTHTLQTGPRVH